MPNLQSQRDYAMALLEASTYHPHLLDTNVASQQAQTLAQYVTLNPADVDALDALGDLLIRADQVAHGYENYRKLHTQQPGREHTAVMMANVCLTHGQFERAAELWEAIVEQHDPVAIYRTKLCEAYQGLGRWRDLKRVAQVGTEKFPTTDSFWRYLATASAVLGDSATASKSLDQLIQIRPEHEQAIRAWFDGLTRDR